jgi:hypothetical protein
VFANLNIINLPWDKDKMCWQGLVFRFPEKKLQHFIEKAGNFIERKSKETELYSS